MNARMLASLAAVSFVLASNVGAAQTAAGTEERVTRSAAGPSADHAADELRDPTSFELLRRKPDEIAVKPRVAPAKARKTSARTATRGSTTRTTDIFADRDSDGYFSYLRVQFDADTIYTDALRLRRDLLQCRRHRLGAPVLDAGFRRSGAPIPTMTTRSRRSSSPATRRDFTTC